MIRAQGIALDHALDIHVAIKTMMALTRYFIGEETEEQEDISNADALPPKMRLGRTALSEQAAATEEHRILVAQMIRANPAARDLLNQVAEAKITITGC